MVGVGEGGMVLSRSEDLLAKARWWSARAPTKGVGPWRVYEHDSVGSNARMPELLGAVGAAAAENLPVMIERKRRIHAWYLKHLDCDPTTGAGKLVAMQTPVRGDFAVFWLNAIRLLDARLYNRAEQVGSRLMAMAPHVEIRPAFFPLNRMRPFEKCSEPCPNTEHVYATWMCVPSAHSLTEDEVASVCSFLKRAIADELAAVEAADSAALNPTALLQVSAAKTRCETDQSEQSLLSKPPLENVAEQPVAAPA